MPHLREERSIPLWTAAKWKKPFWIFFFPISSRRASVFVPEATLPTCDYSAGPEQMLWWISARCWVPCTRGKPIAVVQDMVQTQLFQRTSSWNHLLRWVFSSESQFEHLTLNNKERELKCAKSSQQAQVQSICPNSSFLTAPHLSARQYIQSSHHMGPISNRQKICLPKPFWIKTLHFWQWSTVHSTCRIAMERSFCQKHSSYYCRLPGFAWKSKNPNSSLAFFGEIPTFVLL